MNAAEPTPLRCPQGTTFRRTLTVKDNGSPVNLTGYSATMIVKATSKSPDTLVSLDVGSGVTMGGSAGTITLVIDETVTANLPLGQYRYAVRLVAPDTTTDRIMYGPFVISDDLDD